MMDVSEYQHHLAALHYYATTVDGAYGPKTREAIKRFQRAHKKRPDGSVLAVDGFWGPKTEKALRDVIGNDEKPQADSFDLYYEDGGYKWLHVSQVRCQCGGKYCRGLPDDRRFSTQTLQWANQIGANFGKVITITSGYRCPRHNAETPGASPHSRHTLAQAIDLKVPGHKPEEVYAFADKLIGDRGGVGIYQWGIHIDSRGFRSRWDYR